ncbi:GNAT family N-acetyltransferase [Lactococcus sp.]|uniref:GNAT family N-acetyltransferase n=1 Tax=Lactococcus sp. TaxID=44273 RepID=UPI0035B2ECFE
MNKNLILAQHQVFETDQLILRKVELADAPAIYDYTKDEACVKFISLKPSQSLEETQIGIATYFMENRLTCWGIVDKTTDEFLGTIDMRVNGDSGNFGWILKKSHWGRGIVPEAAQTLLDFAFNELGLKVITAEHFAENQKSGRVMEKIGMKKMGQIYVYVDKLERSVLCDYWALTGEEYEKMHG